MAGKLWLDVPFHEKDEAKRLGARWDGREKRWYATDGRVADDCARWAARPDLPDLLPGEDRSFGKGLFVDLVPSSCWFTNVRSCISKTDWERLRRMVIGRAGERCEICGIGEDRKEKRWLEAHERWSYDEAKNVQTLKRIICLCTDCHRTTHFGFAMINGDEWVFDFLMEITGMDATDAGKHVDDAFALWEKRSQKLWELDLSILTDCDVEIMPPPASGYRAAVAHRSIG